MIVKGLLKMETSNLRCTRIELVESTNNAIKNVMWMVQVRSQPLFLTIGYSSLALLNTTMIKGMFQQRGS